MDQPTKTKVKKLLAQACCIACPGGHVQICMLAGQPERTQKIRALYEPVHGFYIDFNMVLQLL